MADLFTRQSADTNIIAPGARSGAVIDDDQPVGQPSISGGGKYRADTRARVIGKLPAKHRAGAFRYDVTKGQSEMMEYSVTMDSIMAMTEAGALLHALHMHWGVETAAPGLLATLDDAFFFCHTLNSGSVLTPGRAGFSIPGSTVNYTYVDSTSLLGVDTRRFFRAYADFIVEVNTRVINNARLKPDDQEAQEKFRMLVMVAQGRGLHRHPQLAHDSADACMNLTPAEFEAVMQAKKLNVGTTPNSVDAMRSRKAIASVDAFNSTTGENYVPAG